mmetsp:Transcript_60747/g.130503  ORF Transcript_60747/g.130503 Transcript_60747/m.130503 type:complete len:365 (+) Transcript_60747:69-1163(+)
MEEVSPLGSDVVFKRLPEFAKDALMGRCKRSAITGDIKLCNMDTFPSFSLVDLCTRKSIPKLSKGGMYDKYVFRPVPMGYRTWIYHDWYRTKRICAGKKGRSIETAMMEEVLEQRCIDAPVSGGRWSPLKSWAALALATPLLGDRLVTMLALGVLFVLFFCSRGLNHPGGYFWLRPTTLPFRLAFFGYLCYWLTGPGSDDMNFGVMVGFLLVLMIFLIDVIIGDVAVVTQYKFTCNYTVVRTLPNRVCICRRHGACSTEDYFGSRGQVDECVSSFGSWEPDMIIIADIYGVLAELRPMEPMHWMQVHREFVNTNVPVSYVCLSSLVYGQDPRLDMRKLNAFQIWAQSKAEDDGEAESKLVVEEL